MPKDSPRVDYHAVTSERLGQVFDVARSSSDFWGLATAAVLQLAVIALVCTVINVDIILPYWSEWSERTRLLYTTGTTILATIVTALTVGSIRKSWFNRISHAEPTSSSSDKKGRAQMRALTGLAEWKEQIIAWPVFVAFLIVGLATTVIVVALTPRATATNDLGSPGHICTSTGGFCTNAFARRSTAGRLFSWTLPDGTLIGLDQNITNLRSYCSPRPAIDLLTTGIAQILPSDAAYVLEDTLITQSAIGMPWDSDLVDYVFGAQRTPEFRWTSRCLPLLTKNPVSCKQGGTVTVSETNRTLTVSNGDCTVTSNALRVQPSTNAATVMGACTENHDVGTATILIGAVDEIFGFEGNGLVVKDGSYAQQLKNALDLASLDGREFSATCTIDVPSAMGLRSLNYSRVDDLRAPVSINAQDKSQPVHRSGYGYQVSAISNDTCKMVDWNSDEDITIEQFKYPGMLATAAGAS
ncbi:hypothetical protein DL98DRAFT_617346 [Cadophora sp. DSE1049]|nr:hypothetical protein DL98DRAFT_617346 [Cadophora sp. DSE1049]